jgi:hypothetical protein
MPRGSPRGLSTSPSQGTTAFCVSPMLASSPCLGRMTGFPPTPVTCPYDAPPPGERPCRHSLPKGACDRPDEFLCVEWLKGNGPRASVGANDPTANVVAGDVDADAASTTTGGFSHRWRSLFDHAPPGLAPPAKTGSRAASSAGPDDPAYARAAPGLAGERRGRGDPGLVLRRNADRDRHARPGLARRRADGLRASRAYRLRRRRARGGLRRLSRRARPRARTNQEKSTQSTAPCVPKPRARWLCLV